MFPIVRAMGRRSSFSSVGARRFSDDGTGSMPRLLTLDEEKKILKPFARSYYRAARVQQEAGLLNPREACVELKNYLYQDGIAWVLLLALLLTSEMMSLFNLRMPNEDQLNASIYWTGFSRMTVVALEASFACATACGFLCNLMAINAVIVTCTQINSTPDAAIGRFLVHKWGASAPDEWWHNFFPLKTLTLFFLLLALLFRSLLAFGLPCLAFWLPAALLCRLMILKVYAMTFAFANRAIEDLMKDKGLIDELDGSLGGTVKSGGFDNISMGGSRSTNAKRWYHYLPWCVRPLAVFNTLRNCLLRSSMPKRKGSKVEDGEDMQSAISQALSKNGEGGNRSNGKVHPATEAAMAVPDVEEGGAAVNGGE